jgi:hypothetical protein
MWLTAGETRGVSNPNKWNEFSDIRKIHRTCRTKGFLTKFILRPTPLLAAPSRKTLNLPSTNRRAAGIFVVSRAGEEYDVSKSEILVGFATTVRDARKASGVFVGFELEKAVRVCQGVCLIPEFPGVGARPAGEKGSRSCII